MKDTSRIFTKHFPAMLALGAFVLVALACGFKSDSQWQNELGGKQLTSAKNSGSVSDRTDIWFCPNGEYAKKTQFSGFSGGGAGDFSMADEDVELGNWTIESGRLLLQSENGKTTEYGISQGTDPNVIRLNGNGYLVSKHNYCGR